MNQSQPAVEDDSREPFDQQLEVACHDISSALATVNLCIEFLAERADSLGEPAVEDAHTAVRRIADVLFELRANLQPPGQPAGASSAARRARRRWQP